MEPEVERYYRIVESHLKEVRLWEETVRKFPPMTIREAVRRIIDRLDEYGIDPEVLDWGAMFESLKDFSTVAEFIKYLERERYIPPSREEYIEVSSDELERELTELLDKAKDVDIDVVRRIRDRISDILGEAGEVARLKREVEELKARVKRERRLRDEYARKYEDLQKTIERLRNEIENLRREVERARRLPIPPTVPVEEKRARFEYHLKSQIPRVYRIDWFRDIPLRCRISVHRDEWDRLLSKIRELGGEFIEEAPVRPPMRVAVVDFSEAPVPPAPPPPIEWERMILWGKFSAAISAAGGDPERYRDRFEEVLEALADRPFSERQRAVEILARDIVSEITVPPRPPVRRPPPAPPTPPPERVVVGLVMPEPEVTTRIDPETGEVFLSLDDTSLSILKKVLPFPLEWYMASPSRQREEFRWPTLLMAIEDALARPEVHIPAWVFSVYPWILEFLKRARDRLREAGAR